VCAKSRSGCAAEIFRKVGPLLDLICEMATELIFENIYESAESCAADVAAEVICK